MDNLIHILKEHEKLEFPFEGKIEEHMLLQKRLHKYIKVMMKEYSSKNKTGHETEPVNNFKISKNIKKQDIPASNFWSLVDQYFRNITQEDIDSLGQIKKIVYSRESNTPCVQKSISSRFIEGLSLENINTNNIMNNPSLTLALKKIGMHVKENIEMPVTGDYIGRRNRLLESKIEEIMKEMDEQTKIIKKRLEKWLTIQEYYNILEEIYKSINTLYQKRANRFKKKKENLSTK